MRIGIDGRILHWPAGRTGAARYLSEILACWKQQQEHQFFVYASAHIPEAGAWSPHFYFRQLDFPIRSNIVWENTVLPWEIQRDRLDVFFSPFFTMPYMVRCKTVVTIHDLLFEIGPQWFPLRKRLYFKLLSRLSVLRASALIVDSLATQTDLVRYYHVPAKKVVAIPLGAPSPKSGFQMRERGGSGLDGQRPYPYILSVGAIHPRKNPERLLQAFARLKRMTDGQNYKLIFAGKFESSLGASETVLRGLVRSLHLDADVIFTGYVDDKELENLYVFADLLVFPSLYEGFGLPILEAMSYGVPVVTSNVSSMPEVAGDAALLVNPYNVDDIAQAMLAILSDSSLRDNLTQRGFEHIKSFSWEATAQQTLQVLLQVCEAGR